MNREELFQGCRIIVQQVLEQLDQKRTAEGFSLLIQQMQPVQDSIMELADGEFLLPEDIQQLSKYLLQALENKDAVLLYDVLKYALLDVLNQLLG